ncbi:arylsulfatase [Mesorhizobium sp. Root554]|uniref:sulfatase-like hydrolase/transferase n=1 Tax=unclassified Mesorhizobium TaxID=325217 RepID=UPI0006FA3B15|nr:MULTISPECIES: sulfatase-like hydrolase/transferase [unclassified Mesorhizobium]KQZ14157.1 arylsulfatase [Mesorhizobium sp. Root1471]KQZ36669.1 arylsulfatase [Mesorhizobium sp. Root554]
MKKPNVIVFFTDQQRHDTTGVHGNPMGLTPNFDRLARGGTHLFHSFTSQPLCGPARSSMQTGQFATQTGVFRNGIPLADDAETIAKVFARNGYSTGYIGKWHLGSEDPVRKHQRGGYQSWLGANLAEFVSDSYDAVLFDDNDNKKKLPGYRVDALTDAAIRYCDQHQEDPFFLFLSFLEPHHQNHVDDYPPPDGYREAMTATQWTPPDLATLKGTSSWHLGGYYGMVKRLDEAFGRLIDALKSLDMLDNTIVMFTSDHACHFKTRNSEYKRSCHESAVRVPTMITGPGFMAGGQVKALFSTIDVAPTLIDAAGLEVPDSMTGQSIMPVVRDARLPWRQDVFFQISETETGRALRTHRWKYGVTSEYDKDLASSDVYRESYLYDLDNDPYEMVNLVGMDAFREVADGLKARLLAWIDEIEGATPTVLDAAPRYSRQYRLKATDLLGFKDQERDVDAVKN